MFLNISTEHLGSYFVQFGRKAEKKREVFSLGLNKAHTHYLL